MTKQLRSRQRILIIGCSGSGKTILAHQIAPHVNAPITHLDAIYYDSTWQPIAADEFARRQRDLASGERWIIDGNYASTLAVRLARADTVIFLDLPAWTCLWGIAQRRWRYRGGQHDDGVYDRLNWSVITYILGYRRRMRPRVLRLVAAYDEQVNVVRLTSRGHIQRFLRTLSDTEPAS